MKCCQVEESTTFGMQRFIQAGWPVNILSWCCHSQSNSCHQPLVSFAFACKKRGDDTLGKARIYEVLNGPLNPHFLQVCNFEITCKKLIAHITSWDCSILCSLRTKLIMKIDFWFWGCRIWKVDWIIGLMDFNLALKEHFSQQGFLLETHVAFQDDLLNTCSKNWKFA